MRKGEFAKLLGVTPPYVSQLAAANRLVLSADGKKVLVAESLALIAKTGSADKVGVAARKALERQQAGGSAMPIHQLASAIAWTVGEPSAMPPRDATPAEPLTSGRRPEHLLMLGDYLGAKNAAEAANAIKRGEDMDIELAKKRGDLVSREATIKVLADLAAATRAAYERIPDRIATRLAAESDPSVVFALLQEAVDEVAATLSKQAGEIANKL